MRKLRHRNVEYLAKTPTAAEQWKAAFQRGRVCVEKTTLGDFPGSPVVKTSPSNARDTGSISGWGAKIPHASWPKTQNIKQKR